MSAKIPLPLSTVVLAGQVQFGRGAQFSASCVQSRMLVWCDAGNGRITVNEEKFAVSPGDFMFLPWGHRIHYVASQTAPFHLGGIHVIPRYEPGPPVIYEVAHSAESPLYDSRLRRDVAGGGASGILLERFENHPELEALTLYAFRVFEDKNPREWKTRYLGALFMDYFTTSFSASARPAVSTALQVVLDYAKFNLPKDVNVSGMAETINVNRSTLHRMFRQELKVSPVDWLSQLRMEQAKKLLKTTPYPVGEVARAVGMPDIYYFSRRFKQFTGQTPTYYRRNNRRRLL